MKGRLSQPGNLVAFRADGGPQTGMGHIVRCLALADALGLPAVFLSRPDEVTGSLVRRAGFDYLAVAEPGSWSRLVERLQPAALVVDNYAVSGGELAAVKETVPLLVVVDDLGDRSLPADILINGNITAPDLGYAGDKLLLLGPEYLPLRGCFRGMPPKEVPAVARKVLVTSGGGDPFHVTLPILERLLGLDLNVKVACGPQFAGRAEVELLIGERASYRGAAAASTVELLDNPDMAALMQWADLAISTGGSTLYELCAAGVPALAIAVAANQEASARKLGSLGYLTYLGRSTDVFDGRGVDLRQAVATMIRDSVSRAAMSRNGRRLVDGRGAERCAAVIKARMVAAGHRMKRSV